MERDFREIIDIIGDKTEVERSTILQSQAANQNGRRYEQIMNALLYAIFTNDELYQQVSVILCDISAYTY